MLMYISVRQETRQCCLFFLTTRRSHYESLYALLTPKALLPKEIVLYAFLDIFFLVVVFFLDQQVIRLWKTIMTKMHSVASGPILPHSLLCVVLGDPDDQMWKVSLLHVIDKIQILSKYRHDASFRQIFCEYMRFFVTIKKIPDERQRYFWHCQESNLDLGLRRTASYPLNDSAIKKHGNRMISFKESQIWTDNWGAEDLRVPSYTIPLYIIRYMRCTLLLFLIRLLRPHESAHL